MKQEKQLDMGEEAVKSENHGETKNCIPDLDRFLSDCVTQARMKAVVKVTKNLEVELVPVQVIQHAEELLGWLTTPKAIKDQG